MPQRLLYVRAVSCTKVHGNDGLGRLTHAVCAALHKGTDIYNGSVYRKGVGAEVFHDLTLKDNYAEPREKRTV